MRIFNKDKTVELTEYDETKGSLVPDQLFVAHHEAVQGVAEQGYYETIKEYPNGGKDMRWKITTPAVQSRAAYDEYEDILVFIPFSEAKCAAFEIADLKQQLRDTDYQAIKYAEGFISEEEYAPIKAQRQAWRERINELEVIASVDEGETTENIDEIEETEDDDDEIL